MNLDPQIEKEFIDFCNEIESSVKFWVKTILTSQYVISSFMPPAQVRKDNFYFFINSYRVFKENSDGIAFVPMNVIHKELASLDYNEILLGFDKEDCWSMYKQYLYTYMDNLRSMEFPCVISKKFGKDSTLQVNVHIKFFAYAEKHIVVKMRNGREFAFFDPLLLMKSRCEKLMSNL